MFFNRKTATFFRVIIFMAITIGLNFSAQKALSFGIAESLDRPVETLYRNSEKNESIDSEDNSSNKNSSDENSAKNPVDKNSEKKIEKKSKKKLVIPKEPVLVEMQTRHSEYVASFQEKFGRPNEKMQVLFIDKDWFTLNHALNLGKGYESPSIYAGLLHEHIKRNTDFTLSAKALATLSDSVKSNFAHATRVSKADLIDQTTNSPVTDGREICVIIGRKVDHSADQQMRYMMGFNRLQVGDIHNAEITSKMELDDLHDFTDFHELGHCLDEWYIPTIVNEHRHQANEGDLNLKHKSEVFGEVFSVLALAKAGKTSVTEARKNHRLVAFGTHGVYTAKLNSTDYQEHYLGYIYAVHRAIEGAAKAASQTNIENYTLKELAELAHRVTEEFSFQNSPAQHAMSYLLSNYMTTPNWERLSKKFDHIKPRWELAKKLYAETEKAFKDTFDLGEVENAVGFLKGLPFYKEVHMKRLPPNDDEFVYKKLKSKFRKVFLQMHPIDEESLSTVVSFFLDNTRMRLLNSSIEMTKEAEAQLRVFPKVLNEVLLELRAAKSEIL